MAPQFTDEDLELLSDEANSLRSIWAQTDILGKSLKLCRGAVLGSRASADLVARAAICCLLNRKPFSLVRIGDGEGNVLAVLGETTNQQLNLKAFNSIFYIQDLQCLSEDDAKGFCRTMEHSVCDADVLGIRSLNPWETSSLESLEMSYVFRCLDAGNARGAHGILHARKQIERLLDSGGLADAILTQAWVHLSLIPALPEIINASERLIVITGRSELRSEFLSRFGSKPLEFIQIPLEGTRRQGPHHFPVVYDQILERMSDDLSGTLVLIGAGIFGKAYCHVAKQHGAVALDLGSAFDVLSGLKTRPVHDRRFVEEMRWTAAKPGA